MANVPPTEAVERKAADLTKDCLSLEVADNQSYERAAHMLKVVAAVRAEVEETFGPVVASAHAAHKAALAAKAKHDEPLKAAERHLKASMGGYAAEQERVRQAEQRRLAAIAQAEAEAEAKRLAEEQVLELAIEAEQAGDDEQAEAILAEPLPPPEPVFAAPVIVPRSTPQVAGISSRQTWKAECCDLLALVRAVAAGQAPIDALQPNVVFLGQQARSLRSALRYPGIRVWAEESVAVRR
jgi:hypothetical protein